MLRCGFRWGFPRAFPNRLGVKSDEQGALRIRKVLVWQHRAVWAGRGGWGGKGGVIWLHSRPKPAAGRAPISLVNSSEPSEKRPSASICQRKRSGTRRVFGAGPSSHDGGLANAAATGGVVDC